MKLHLTSTEELQNTFLRIIEKLTPKDKQVHLIVDNYATHKHLLVKRWLERRPRFHVHVTPTSYSWLNMVERLFRDLMEKQVLRGVFRNIEELPESIGEYIDNHNRQPKPFIWTPKRRTSSKRSSEPDPTGMVQQRGRVHHNILKSGMRSSSEIG